MVSSKRFAAAVALLVLSALGVARLQGEPPQVIISEFLASNSRSLEDMDGDRSDWIELFNLSPTLVSLDGWTLTDDPERLQKWTFPDVEIGPGEFLIVFASGKDLKDPAGELHTNFALSPDGELLVLADPSGTPVSLFSPQYPKQVGDVSYGIKMDLSQRKLIAQGDAARFLIPTDNDLGTTWIAQAFDDAAWSTGPTGLGYDTKAEPTYKELIATDVGAQMANVVSSLYVRIPFSVDAADVNKFLEFRVRYNDGFAAFLNGVEIARENCPSSTLRNSSRASTARAVGDSLSVQKFLIARKGLLQPGTNVLAIQALNIRSTDLDLFLVPELDLVEVASAAIENQGYFQVSTPGMPNTGEVLQGVADEPGFSLPSGAYVEPMTLELSATYPDMEVRYTLNGLEPTETSTLYSAAITIDTTMVVKARAFQQGYAASPTVTQTYLFVESRLFDFTSTVPIVICSTIGRALGSNCGGGDYTPGELFVFAPGEDGKARVSDVPNVAEIAAYRRRGSSTCGDAKYSFNVEVKESYDPEKTADLRAPDKLGVSKNVNILDFSRDSDFVMYGPYGFDRALMRNAVAYWLSRQAGRWAARTQFAECYFVNNTTAKSRAARTTDYMGVYIFMEKNKRNPQRIDVEGMTSKDNAEPRVRGGYIFRRDRVGSGEVATSAGGYDSLVFAYPQLPTTAQRSWITSHITKVISSLNPNIGSQADTDLLDFGQWVDHHILCWYPKNVDAFRLSGYFFKRRDGMMAMGPVWDYDRTMGCADDARAATPEGWNNDASGDGGTQYFAAGGMGSWYSFLFSSQPPTSNTPWNKAYRARWRELRAGPFKSETITAQIDAWGKVLQEPAVRNFQKWPGTSPRYGSFQGEVNHLKDWLTRRATWIDAQFIEPPTFSPPAGRVALGTEVSIATTVEGVEIYYTTNGTDPMAAGGAVAAAAVLYAGPIAITQNTRIRARLRMGSASWSNPADGMYVTHVPPVAVTEIMYAAPVYPEDIYTASKFDFVEIHNFGDVPLDISTLNMTRPRFNFANSAVKELQPGGYLAVVADLTAFRARYGDAPKVAGVYTTSLVDTRGTVEVQGPIGEVFVLINYDSTWYPTTRSQGYSLVLVDPQTPFESLSQSASWKPSAELKGSPGREDGTGPAEGLQLPGDLSQDQKLNVTDVPHILSVLFGGAAGPCSTEEGNTKLGDMDGDGEFGLTDAIHLLNYLFRRGDPPALGTACVSIAGCPSVCPAQ